MQTKLKPPIPHESVSFPQPNIAKICCACAYGSTPLKRPPCSSVVAVVKSSELLGLNLLDLLPAVKGR